MWGYPFAMRGYGKGEDEGISPHPEGISPHRESQAIFTRRLQFFKITSSSNIYLSNDLTKFDKYSDVPDIDIRSPREWHPVVFLKDSQEKSNTKTPIVRSMDCIIIVPQ